MDHKKIKSDVLVIGGSEAGLTAALESNKLGADTVIVSKGKLGKSGNALISGCGHNAPFGHENDKDSPRIFFEDTLQSGKFLNNRDLVDILTQEACARVRELDDLGVGFEKKNGKFIQYSTPGHSYPRSCYTEKRKGLEITSLLADLVKSTEIKTLDNIMVFSVFQEKGSIEGAMGMNKNTGELYVFSTKAIVLATGGAGKIYKTNNNVVGTTGDGYSMALEAGAELIDMEFFQFYPHRVISPVNMNVSPMLFKMGAKLLNKEGERFMKKYDPTQMEESTRDVKSRAIFTEVLNGDGVKGGVYLDLSKIKEKELKRLNYKFYNALEGKGVDYRKDDLIISPIAHFYMGGIKVDRECETRISNFFACGEVAGGIHGANRLANNALTSALVFGSRAGRYAAKSCKDMNIPKIDEFKIKKSKNRIYKKRNESYTKIDLAQIKKELQEMMWGNAGIVKSGESLNKTLKCLNKLEKESLKFKSENIRNITHSLELENMITVSRVLVLSSLARAESRGSHYRSDYPNTNDEEFLGNIIVKKRNSEIITEKYPI
ncbi:hypothetical protein AKJ62_03555 [candidate division MSBL1 archaeon SCGC-AAA259D14]|uniref:L-aspartate oxidase n=1 Tax=candidate division MSBL1 archaeon SCGC-AAA259D14 TaxID=1698261 RepID=A0A133U4T8_9EURY|nr:hypothetical protein AKJ62_03555 [candidate division MSBL1 archaeon SCGC-AAA259D14]